MGLKRLVFRGSNGLLKRFGLRLSVVKEAFDARLDRPAQLQRVFSKFGEIADAWLSSQTIFRVRNRSRFNNLAWLYVIAKAMQPSLVIEGEQTPKEDLPSGNLKLISVASASGN